MQVAVSEFQRHGLGLDWTTVTMDEDLHRSTDGWCYHSLRGTKGAAAKKPERRQYLKTAYLAGSTTER